MTETSIYREPTQEEKKDMIDIRKPQQKTGFQQQCINEENMMSTSKKPFCRRCALLDYKDYQENQTKEQARGATTTLKKPEIETYKEPKRFQKLKETTKDFTHYKGGPTQTVTYTEYRCRIRGCGISIQEKTAPKQENTPPTPK